MNHINTDAAKGPQPQGIPVAGGQSMPAAGHAAMRGDMVEIRAAMERICFSIAKR